MHWSCHYTPLHVFVAYQAQKLKFLGTSIQPISKGSNLGYQEHQHLSSDHLIVKFQVSGNQIPSPTKIPINCHPQNLKSNPIGILKTKSTIPIGNQKHQSLISIRIFTNQNPIPIGIIFKTRWSLVTHNLTILNKPKFNLHWYPKFNLQFYLTFLRKEDQAQKIQPLICIPTCINHNISCVAFSSRKNITLHKNTIIHLHSHMHWSWHFMYHAYYFHWGEELHHYKLKNMHT